MKYYLIVGEPSGDLHASHLMAALREKDEAAQFRFFGGDLMAEVAGPENRVRHYKDLAYMGFIPVLLHLRTILRTMSFCKKDVLNWQPDVLILVDYPGFNLSVAKYIKLHSNIPIFYYISPKIWAWKEYRIKSIKENVDELFSILPFEVPFFEEKHHFPIHYVGNPTVDEVSAFQKVYAETKDEFCVRLGLDERPILALLAGSRKQEIKDNLKRMLLAAANFPQYQCVLAGAPSITNEEYNVILRGLLKKGVSLQPKVVFLETYPLLSHAELALVTSGTATLETALFRVPQVVCYYIAAGRFFSFLRKFLLKVNYISLVNLVLGREAVSELVAEEMTVERIQSELKKLQPSRLERAKLQLDYEEMADRLGEPGAPEHTAKLMLDKLNQVKIAHCSGNR
ncbi:MAG: lipid-A-disaccharide synthase [Bacteroidaceae bacterium]|nr:lipid-A-disaccharide synthase [Bacteroidaceae bacterium]